MWPANQSILSNPFQKLEKKLNLQPQPLKCSFEVITSQTGVTRTRKKLDLWTADLLITQEISIPHSEMPENACLKHGGRVS